MKYVATSRTIPPPRPPMIESTATINGPDVLLPRAKIKNEPARPSGKPPPTVYVPAESMENVITE